MTTLPPGLTLRLKNIFSKEEMTTLKKTFSLEKRSVSFRLNTLKGNHEEIEEGLKKSSVSYKRLDFPKDCYLLDEQFSESDLWKRRIYKDGKIYLQSISSQIPVSFFGDLSNSSLGSKIKILDSCAAPGGKTSQLSALYPDAQIYAFEPSKIRYDKMCYNLEKLGCKNVTMVHSAIENIKTHIPRGDYFDLILVDAPCSSEGAILYNKTKLLETWDISHINKNYKRQKRICDTVIPYLKNSGELIYSTCTLAPEENEAIVHYLLCNYSELSLEKIDLSDNKYIKTVQALKAFGKNPYKKEVSENCVRVIPSEYSEGFFIAKFIKGEHNTRV